MRHLILLAPLALLLAACGGGGDAATTNTVQLRGDDFAFVLPERVEGGWTTIDFENTGDHWHEFALAKLGEGKTLDDVKKYLADPKAQEGPPPDWVQIRAGIPTLDAGESASLTQKLEPGRYVLLCFLPGPGGKSHIERGMLRAFEVGADAGAEPPKVDATLRLGGGLAAPKIPAGERTFELRNDAAKPGSVFLTEFKPGKTEADLTRWEEAGAQGPAPARFLGGAIDVPAKSSVYLTLTLDEGREYTLFDDVHGIQKTFTPS